MAHFVHPQTPAGENDVGCEGLLDLCRTQHDDIAALLATWIRLGTTATVTRRLLAAELLRALEEHLDLEMNSFVPLYRQVDAERACLAEEHLRLLRGMVRVVSRSARTGRDIESKMILLSDLFLRHRSEQEDHEIPAVRNTVLRLTREGRPSPRPSHVSEKNSIRIC